MYKALVKMRNKKGFTLMELLIVVAIIAILAAIAIPTFASSLERARESADEANGRSLYAAVALSYITEEAIPAITVSTDKKTLTLDGVAYVFNTEPVITDATDTWKIHVNGTGGMDFILAKN